MGHRTATFQNLGAGGLGDAAYKDRARPPPPPPGSLRAQAVRRQYLPLGRNPAEHHQQCSEQSRPRERGTPKQLPEDMCCFNSGKPLLLPVVHPPGVFFINVHVLWDPRMGGWVACAGAAGERRAVCQGARWMCE